MWNFSSNTSKGVSHQRAETSRGKHTLTCNRAVDVSTEYQTTSAFKPFQVRQWNSKYTILTMSVNTPGLMRLIILATWYTPTALSLSSCCDKVTRAQSMPAETAPNLDKRWRQIGPEGHSGTSQMDVGQQKSTCVCFMKMQGNMFLHFHFKTFEKLWDFLTDKRTVTDVFHSSNLNGSNE